MKVKNTVWPCLGPVMTLCHRGIDYFGIFKGLNAMSESVLFRRFLPVFVVEAPPLALLADAQLPKPSDSVCFDLLTLFQGKEGPKNPMGLKAETFAQSLTQLGRTLGIWDVLFETQIARYEDNFAQLGARDVRVPLRKTETRDLVLYNGYDALAPDAGRMAVWRVMNDGFSAPTALYGFVAATLALCDSKAQEMAAEPYAKVREFQHPCLPAHRELRKTILDAATRQMSARAHFSCARYRAALAKANQALQRPGPAPGRETAPVHIAEP